MSQSTDPISLAADARTAEPLPTIADIEAAADRLRGIAFETPLLPLPDLSATLGADVYAKPECLQRTGSFKFRGAYNRVSLIPSHERKNGVVACSSGNHAQGVAAAAALYGIAATIVMPRDAPAMKIARTRLLGAEVVLYDRETEDREAIARGIAAREGATFIHPYDDAGVIAGQGTVGLEIVHQAKARGIEPDTVLVPASGGGLTAGIGLALHAGFPLADLLTVEPDGFDDHARSLEAGERQVNERLSGSICDALLSSTPGKRTFAINQGELTGGISVSDDEVLAAVGYAAREIKVVVEPGGAVALAAAMVPKIDLRGRTVVLVLSGGNIEPALLAQALAL